MKKILLVALIALFVAGSVYAAGPTGPGAAGDIMGQAKYQTDPHRVFRLVHFGDNATATATGTSIPAGSVVIWDSYLDDGVSVTTTTTSADARTAGLLITAVVSGDTAKANAYTTASDDAGISACWGWLQTYGKSVENPTAETLTPTGKAIGVGDSVSAGGVAGQITEFMFTGMAASGAANATANTKRLGFAYDAIAAAAAGEIFITCE